MFKRLTEDVQKTFKDVHKTSKRCSKEIKKMLIWILFSPSKYSVYKNQEIVGKMSTSYIRSNIVITFSKSVLQKCLILFCEGVCLLAFNKIVGFGSWPQGSEN
jgi:hypothetical protein